MGLGGSVPTNSFDINMVFNSEYTWWFQGDPPIGPSQEDFEQVATHELIHGMGFITGEAATDLPLSSNYDRILNGFTYNSSIPVASFGNTFESSGGDAIASARSVYGMASSGNRRLYFQPKQNPVANDPIYLWSASWYSGGSAISHFDDGYEYTPDLLMISYSRMGATLDQKVAGAGGFGYGAIGPHVLSVLNSIGWNINALASPLETATSTSSVQVDTTTQTATTTNTVTTSITSTIPITSTSVTTSTKSTTSITSSTTRTTSRTTTTTTTSLSTTTIARTTTFPASISQGAQIFVFPVRLWTASPMDVFVELHESTSGALVSNYAYNPASGASSSGWAAYNFTVTPTVSLTNSAYNWFTWMTPPGAGWSGNVFTQVVRVTIHAPVTSTITTSSIGAIR
ncbi:hypothetical protein HDU93_002881 [Gonapodya sp. JEL0774]|nr:hypothetical protein HDU93_002881 [Gonapodya sp. JEL0774]